MPTTFTRDAAVNGTANWTTTVSDGYAAELSRYDFKCQYPLEVT